MVVRTLPQSSLHEPCLLPEKVLLVTVSSVISRIRGPIPTGEKLNGFTSVDSRTDDVFKFMITHPRTTQFIVYNPGVLRKVRLSW